MNEAPLTRCPECGRVFRSAPDPSEPAACPHCARPIDAGPTDALVSVVPSGAVMGVLVDRGQLALANERGGLVPRFLMRTVGWWSPDGTDVKLLWSGALALVVTVAFYRWLVPLIDHTYTGQLFSDRGQIPYVIAFFSFWAFAILLLKYVALCQQRRPFQRALLPVKKSLDLDDCRELQRQIRRLRRGDRRTFLLARLESAVAHHAEHNDPASLAQLLDDHADLDDDRVDSGYAMLRVLIWAIPILGFIGTVLGISSAVGSFTQTIGTEQDVSAMKESLGTVTGGLSVAFDTTLLALVMSIFIMFPTNALQKAEIRLLRTTQEFCTFSFLGRIRSGLADGDTAPRAGRAEAAS